MAEPDHETERDHETEQPRDGSPGSLAPPDPGSHAAPPPPPPPGPPYGGPPPPGAPYGGPPPGAPYRAPPPPGAPYGGPYGAPPHGGPYGGPPPPYGPGPYPPPRGPGITAADDTTWALLAYLGQFAVGFVAPLVVYLARKDESPFTRFHGAQALNAALSYTIALVVGVVLAIVGGATTTAVGVLVAIVLIVAIFVFAITHLVYLIIAAVKAGKREMYRIPAWICWRMIK